MIDVRFMCDKANQKFSVGENVKIQPVIKSLVCDKSNKSKLRINGYGGNMISEKSVFEDFSNVDTVIIRCECEKGE